MAIFWSPTCAGFFDDVLHPSLPGDAVEITAQDHADLMAVQATGKRIVDVNGVPAAQDPPPRVYTLAQQAAILLDQGVTIHSAAHPSINGRYATTALARSTVAEVQAGLNAGAGFPGGGGSFDFTLADGSHVTFSDPAVFRAVAIAIRDWVYACIQVQTGRSQTLPAATVDIA